MIRLIRHLLPSLLFGVSALAQEAVSQSAPVAPPMTRDQAAINKADSFAPSFGEWEKSLFFPESRMMNLRRLLASYERYGKEPEAVASTEDNSLIDRLVNSIESKATTEPATYPVFRLSSVVIDPTTGWSVMVNNERLKPGEASPSGLQVLSVMKNAVTFRWQPADPATAVLLSRTINDRKKSTPPKPPQKNRVAMLVPLSAADSGQPVTSDGDGPAPKRAKPSVNFTLRINQSFAPEYMAIYEGKAPQAVTAQSEPETTPEQTMPTPLNSTEASAPLPQNDPAMPIVPASGASVLNALGQAQRVMESNMERLNNNDGVAPSAAPTYPLVDGPAMTSP